MRDRMFLTTEVLLLLFIVVRMVDSNCVLETY